MLPATISSTVALAYLVLVSFVEIARDTVSATAI